MINFKTVAILAMTMALCGFSSTAFAQSSNAIHSASLNTASALPTYQAIGTTISTSNVQPKTKRKLRRIVEPLPELATRKAAPKGKFLSRTPYSKAVNGHMAMPLNYFFTYRQAYSCTRISFLTIKPFKDVKYFT